MGGFSDGLSVSDALLTIRSRLLFDFSGGVMMLSVRRVYHRAIRTIEFMSITRCYLFRNLHADDGNWIARIAFHRFTQLEAVAQKVGELSFSPGFSQVAACKRAIRNRLNGFPRVFWGPSTWLKPGENERKDALLPKLRLFVQSPTREGH